MSDTSSTDFYLEQILSETDTAIFEASDMDSGTDNKEPAVKAETAKEQLEEMEAKNKLLKMQLEQLKLQRDIEKTREQIGDKPELNKTVITADQFPKIPKLQRWDDESLIKLYWKWKGFEQECRTKRLPTNSILNAIPISVSRPYIADKLDGDESKLDEKYVLQAMQQARKSRPRAYETLIFQELEQNLKWCKESSRQTQALDKLMGDLKVILEEADLTHMLDVGTNKYDSKKICRILLEKVQPEALRHYLQTEAETKPIGIDTAEFRKAAAEGLEAIQKVREIIDVAEAKQPGIKSKSIAVLGLSEPTKKEKKARRADNFDSDNQKILKKIDGNNEPLPAEKNICIACKLNGFPHTGHTFGTHASNKPGNLNLTCTRKWNISGFKEYVKMQHRYMKHHKTPPQSGKARSATRKMEKRLQDMEKKMQSQTAELQAWRAGTTHFPEFEDPELVQELGSLSESSRQKLKEKLKGGRANIDTPEFAEFDCRRSELEDITAVVEFLTEDDVYQPMEASMDSGADTVMFSEQNHSKYCRDIEVLETPAKIRVADNKYVYARKRGTLDMRFRLQKRKWTNVSSVRGYLVEGAWPEALFGKTFLSQLNALPEQHLVHLAGKSFKYDSGDECSNQEANRGQMDDSHDFRDQCWA